MKRFLAVLSVTTAVLSFAPVPLVAEAPPPQRPQQPAQPPAAGAAGYTDPGISAETVRERFNEVLQRYPRTVGRVLRLDPSLFSDPNYMANYPAIQQFVQQYPEVARNPDFFLADYGSTYYVDRGPRDPQEQALAMLRDWTEAIMVFIVIAGVSVGLMWLLKALIDHRRWLRISKIQTEVHTKLLDRFASSEELLAYMKTPAGARFLESAPIAVDPGSSHRAVAAPINRILWSVQAGVIILLAGLAPFVARNWTIYEEVRTTLAVLGTLGTFVGLGFIISAGASWFLSQRLGLLDGTRTDTSSSVSAGRVDSASF